MGQSLSLIIVLMFANGLLLIFPFVFLLNFTEMQEYHRVAGLVLIAVSFILACIEFYCLDNYLNL